MLVPRGRWLRVVHQRGAPVVAHFRGIVQRMTLEQPVAFLAPRLVGCDAWWRLLVLLQVLLLVVPSATAGGAVVLEALGDKASRRDRLGI